MKALYIGATSVKRLLRDRSNIFFVFILPMLLILVLGAAFGGEFNPRLGIYGRDVGELGDDLIAKVKTAKAVDVLEYSTEEDLITAVERGQLEAGLIVPPGYDDDLRVGKKVVLEYISRPDQTSQGVRNTIESVATEQGSLLRAAAFAESRGAHFDEVLKTATRIAADSPGVEVQQRAVGEAFALSRLGQFDLGAYSELLLFVFLTSLTGSAALIQSRRLGVSRRMIATPTPVRTVLIGEALGRFGVAMVQGLFIMLGSALIFGVDWGDWLGAVMVLVVFALCAAGVGMLMGSVFRNDQQAGGIGMVLGLGLAALGGCMIPLAVFRIFSPTLWQMAHITPHAWGIEAFEELVIRGGGIVDILPYLGILAGYALVFFALAVWRLRVALTRP